MKQPTLKLREGEKWFVRLPGGSALSKAKIADLSPLCVCLLMSDYSIEGNWYTKTEIKFIERIPADTGDRS